MITETSNNIEMEAKNFRIGNIINIGGNSPCFIVSIDKNHLSVDVPHLHLDDSFESIKDIIPIPLTEKWLTKLQFKKHDTGLGSTLIKLLPQEKSAMHNMPFFMWKKEKGLVGLLDPEYELAITSVKYVHELQNLFFALTGQELTLKAE